MFHGQIEKDAYIASISKQIQLKRLQSVRDQERANTVMRNELFRKCLDERKHEKKRIKKQKILAEIQLEKETLEEKWQKSMYDVGNAHRTAKEKKDQMKQINNNKNQINKYRDMRTSQRAKRAADKHQAETDFIRKREQQKLELQRIREDFRRNEREDARAAGESLLVKKNLIEGPRNWQEEHAKYPVTKERKEKVPQSAVRVHHRFPIRIEAKVTRHGVTRNDSLLVRSDAVTADLGSRRKTWDQVMKEMLTRLVVRSRANKACIFSSRSKAVSSLNEDLRRLEQADKSGVRADRVRNEKMVGPADGDEENVQRTFEKFFLAKRSEKVIGHVDVPLEESLGIATPARTRPSVPAWKGPTEGDSPTSVAVGSPVNGSVCFAEDRDATLRKLHEQELREQSLLEEQRQWRSGAVKETFEKEREQSEEDHTKQIMMRTQILSTETTQRRKSKPAMKQKPHQPKPQGSRTTEILSRPTQNYQLEERLNQTTEARQQRELRSPLPSTSPYSGRSPELVTPRASVQSETPFSPSLFSSTTERAYHDRPLPSWSHPFTGLVESERETRQNTTTTVLSEGDSSLSSSARDSDSFGLGSGSSERSPSERLPGRGKSRLTESMEVRSEQGSSIISVTAARKPEPKPPKPVSPLVSTPSTQQTTPKSEPPDSRPPDTQPSALLDWIYLRQQQLMEEQKELNERYLRELAERRTPSKESSPASDTSATPVPAETANTPSTPSDTVVPASTSSSDRPSSVPDTHSFTPVTRHSDPGTPVFSERGSSAEKPSPDSEDSLSPAMRVVTTPNLSDYLVGRNASTVGAFEIFDSSSSNSTRDCSSHSAHRSGDTRDLSVELSVSTRSPSALREETSVDKSGAQYTEQDYSPDISGQKHEWTETNAPLSTSHSTLSPEPSAAGQTMDSSSADVEVVQSNFTWRSVYSSVFFDQQSHAATSRTQTERNQEVAPPTSNSDSVGAGGEMDVASDVSGGSSTSAVLAIVEQSSASRGLTSSSQSSLSSTTTDERHRPYPSTKVPEPASTFTRFHPPLATYETESTYSYPQHLTQDQEGQEEESDSERDGDSHSSSSTGQLFSRWEELYRGGVALANTVRSRGHLETYGERGSRVPLNQAEDQSSDSHSPSQASNGSAVEEGTPVLSTVEKPGSTGIHGELDSFNLHFTLTPQQPSEYAAGYSSSGSKYSSTNKSSSGSKSSSPPEQSPGPTPSSAESGLTQYKQLSSFSLSSPETPTLPSVARPQTLSCGTINTYSYEHSSRGKSVTTSEADLRSSIESERHAERLFGELETLTRHWTTRTQPNGGVSGESETPESAQSTTESSATCYSTSTIGLQSGSTSSSSVQYQKGTARTTHGLGVVQTHTALPATGGTNLVPQRTLTSPAITLTVQEQQRQSHQEQHYVALHSTPHLPATRPLAPLGSPSLSSLSSRSSSSFDSSFRPLSTVARPRPHDPRTTRVSAVSEESTGPDTEDSVLADLLEKRGANDAALDVLRAEVTEMRRQVMQTVGSLRQQGALSTEDAERLTASAAARASPPDSDVHVSDILELGETDSPLIDSILESSFSRDQQTHYTHNDIRYSFLSDSDSDQPAASSIPQVSQRRARVETTRSVEDWRNSVRDTAIALDSSNLSSSGFSQMTAESSAPPQSAIAISPTSTGSVGPPSTLPSPPFATVRHFQGQHVESSVVRTQVTQYSTEYASDLDSTIPSYSGEIARITHQDRTQTEDSDVSYSTSIQSTPQQPRPTDFSAVDLSSPGVHAARLVERHASRPPLTPHPIDSIYTYQDSSAEKYAGAIPRAYILGSPVASDVSASDLNTPMAQRSFVGHQPSLVDESSISLDSPQQAPRQQQDLQELYREALGFGDLGSDDDDTASVQSVDSLNN